jgi:putative phage-type endonuclease
MKTVSLKQGSQQWHDWRNAILADGGPRIMASDLPIIMGVSPYATPHQLWMQMTGRIASQKSNFAMQRGHKYEPVCRARLEASTGTTITPVCCEALPGEAAPVWAACSLDGISDSWDEIHEIKVPGAKTFQEVLEGKVPEQWYPQIQWQLLVTGVPKCRLTAFDPGDGVVSDKERIASVMVMPDPGYQSKLIVSAEAFRKAVMNDTPLVGDRITSLAVSWLKAYDAVKAAEERLKKAQDALLAEAPDGPRVDTPVATITRATREGTIDYAKLIAELGIDKDVVESYRKPPGKPTITVRRAANADEFLDSWERQLQDALKTDQSSSDPDSDSIQNSGSGLLNW